MTIAFFFLFLLNEFYTVTRIRVIDIYLLLLLRAIFCTKVNACILLYVRVLDEVKLDVNLSYPWHSNRSAQIPRPGRIEFFRST